MGVFQDKTGKRFGRLSVLSRAQNGNDGHTRWLCRCDCGNETVVTGKYLSNKPGRGKTTSCGCVRAEVTGAIRRRHSMTGTRTYRIWKNMRSRCTNPNVGAFADYGGRGISIDPKWDDFDAFLSDMGACPEGYSIERKDNNLGYSASNCRWATRLDQARNKRTTLYILTAQGPLKSHEFMEKHGWSRGKFEHALSAGKIHSITGSDLPSYRTGGVSL